MRRTATLFNPDTSNILVRFAAINDVYELANLPSLHSLLMNLKPQPNAVTLAGDFISPSTLSSIDGGRGMVKTLRACGVTHVSLGNHEADVKQGVLKERLRELSKSATVLNSNIGFKRKSADDEWITEETSSYSIVQSNCKKVSVALFGLMSDESDMFRDGTFKGLQISGVQESLSAFASEAKFRHEPQAYVPMTHMSLRRDQDLAKFIGKSLELDGKVPLIIGGHEHEMMEIGTDEGLTIVKAGQDAERVAVIDLWFHWFSRDLVKVEIDWLDTKTWPECKVVASIRDKHMGVLKAMDETNIIDGTLLPVCKNLNFSMSSVRTRFQQTTVGAWFCQAIKIELEVDVCIINGATIKGGVEGYEGNMMSYSQLKKELPFPLKMVTVEMTRKTLEEAIHWSRTNVEDGHTPEEGEEVERRGYLQTDLDYEDSTNFFTKSGGDPDEVLVVALPRNLMGGFCKIKPLMDLGKELKKVGKMPNKDDYIKAINIIVRFCCRERWNMLSSLTFTDMDLNQDGVLDRDEIKQLMTKSMGEEPTDVMVDLMLSSVDENSDGLIDEDEFTLLMASLKRKGGA